MKKTIEKYIRRILFWILKGKIRSYASSRILNQHDVDGARNIHELKDHLFREMARDIALEMLLDGSLTIEEDDWEKFKGIRYIMRVHTVNFKKRK